MNIYKINTLLLLGLFSLPFSMDANVSSDPEIACQDRIEICKKEWKASGDAIAANIEKYFEANSASLNWTRLFKIRTGDSSFLAVGFEFFPEYIKQNPLAQKTLNKIMDSNPLTSLDLMSENILQQQPNVTTEEAKHLVQVLYLFITGANLLSDRPLYYRDDNDSAIIAEIFIDFNNFINEQIQKQ